MTYYYPALSMTPKDVRYKELKKLLFAFVMKNYDYTQVTTPLLYVPFIYRIILFFSRRPWQ